MITAGVIEPLMRASLCLENEVRNYKRVLLTAIDLCEISDDEEQYEALCELSVSSPALYSFFKPDPLQDRVLNCLNNLSFEEEERLMFIVSLSLRTLGNSLRMANSTLIEAELTDVQDNAVHHNNFAESAFSKLDFIERSRQNLTFLNKETIILSQSNGLIQWLDSLDSTDKSNVLRESRNMVNCVTELMRNSQISEDQLRMDIHREEVNEHARKKQLKASKKSSLLTSLGGCNPQTEESYHRELRNFLAQNNRKREKDFLRLILQLKKLESDGAKPVKAFSCSLKGKPLSTAELRQKLFNLF